MTETTQTTYAAWGKRYGENKHQRLYRVEGRDAPNNLDIQHPYLRDFNTKTDGESSSLPLFFHP